MSNTLKIKNFVKAKSPRRLRSLMMEKQLKLGMTALAFDVMYDTSRKEYVAWYYEILKQENMEELINGDNQKNDRR